ncbi:hypothetical protein F5Y15DRAFT_406680 [Xylariaceae sp. FL0016]|nr:hypothetical protein F5Y15DRAFT_406680 [Xylariaceae sp. FL0016]
MASLSTEEFQTIVRDFNNTDDLSTLHLCFHQLFEHAISEYHDKTAIVCGNRILTYQELNALTNRLARGLIQKGVRSGDIVGVALDRSADLVAILIAVWKAGAAYVPIDPAFPADRISQMLEDASPKLVVTSSELTETFTSWKSICSTVDEITRADSKQNDENPNLEVQSEGLASVMYTSGSTGRPKGVEVTHGNIANLLLSMQREPGCGQTDILLAITTVSFDMAVIEMFLPLLCGATTIIAQRHEVQDTAALARLMDHHKVTIMQGTPAIWQMLVESGWQGQPRLKKIFCGGEALPRQLADRLMDYGDELWNVYGPTEATVFAAIWKVRRDHDIIIGGPITNGRLYVLDANMAPVALGCEGELYIGGTGVARGYRNNSELNQSRFLKNPFHDGLMYRTGDLARFPEAGKLSVIGRVDRQVKIRGYRIELGDIETALSEHEDISGAVVICREDRLIAYYLRKAGAQDIGSGAVAELYRILRPWLAKRLPAYMVPAFFVELEAFPVTANGKIDRNALPDPVSTLQTLSDMAKPAQELEDQLRAIWSKVLGHDRIDIDDNFFEIGGDSLRLVRVQKQLERLLGRPVLAPKLFEHYTIKTLAAYLSSSPDHNVPQSDAQKDRVSDSEDIAVISMACRLPGSTTTPEEFWQLLNREGDAIADVPADRWDANVVHDNSPDSHNKPGCHRGGFLSSINSFDISFFGLSPREARSLDPGQYLMLETCWESFERAGLTMEQLRGSQTGVYIGTSNILSHVSLNPNAVRDLDDLDGYTVTGSAGGTMSGRISYHLGLEGPTMTLDTACSSSLVTTHLACNALRQGECDMAVSGGITLMLNPGMHVEFNKLQGMSPDGRCRSFSADTQGTGWAEGSAVIVLKRLSDAQRDGDLVHAVIRGSAVNHDGRTATLTTPSGASQERLVRTALRAARLQPNDIDYVEAHGTGTKLGDPIEATALAEIFGPTRLDTEPLLLGSAKSNIGHTQAAAGLVGLLKVILAMKNGMLPETLHVTTPTPAVDWEQAKMLPVMKKQPWLSHRGRKRRAGVSAFGIGGTNAHVIVEEPPGRTAIIDRSTPDQTPASLPFLLSSVSDAGLQLQAEKLQEYVSGVLGENDLRNAAFSLATTRTHFPKRIALVANGKDDLTVKLNSIIHCDAGAPHSKENLDKPRSAMLFTGQGSQWPEMGKSLSGVSSVFRETVEEVAARFSELEMPLLEVMWAEPGSATAAMLDRTDFAQPAIFALEAALWRLWQSLGVRPDFVLGHSLGEIVAAHVAGILDLPDACRLVAARGRLMQSQTGDSMMASLGAGDDEVTSAIEQMGCSGRVEVALLNTPTQTVISGDTESVEHMTDYFTERNRKTKTIMVGHAFHSRHMEDMLEDFRTVVETVKFHPPRLAVVSSLSGQLAYADQLQQPDYWVRQIREPVRFSDGIKTLAGLGANIFLELGPQPVLCGMGAACLDEGESKSTAWLPSMKPGSDDSLVLQRSIAELHMRHVPIDWHAYFKPFNCQHVTLPTYAFHRTYHVPQRLPSFAVRKSVDNLTRSKSRRSLEKFQFGIDWHPVDIRHIQPSGTWGVLAATGDSVWSQQVITYLTEAGLRLVHIDLLEDTGRLDGLLCLWESGTDVISQAQDVVGKALEQLQKAAQSQLSTALVWITGHAVGTGSESDDHAMRLGASSLWGLMRTARNEYPELTLRVVDAGEGATSSLASALMLSAEPECAVRQSQVLVPRMQRVSAVPRSSSAKRLIRNDGAVLITGGLGDLGSRVARWLVKDHSVRDLILTSRQGMSSSGADEFIAELSEYGATCVGSIMADFTKERPLRAVVHAAGVSDSGILAAMTPERCATTLKPKVYGAWLLHEHTRDMDLDLFLMFSSISGVLGMQGLANYAAANTFLDALAHLRHARGLPATSVAYGTWAGDGMASRLATTTMTNMNHFGLDTLTTDEGLELFEEAAMSNRALTVAAALDLERHRGYWEEQGGKPPLLSALLVQDRPKASQGQDLSAILRNCAPEKHPIIVLNTVREVVAKALGYTHTLDVDVDRPLQDIGIDSLTAVQMRNRLSRLTGLTLSVNIAFLHPNLRALSQALSSQLRDADMPSTPTASEIVTPATSISEPPYLDMNAVRKGCLDKGFTFQNVALELGRLAKRPESIFLTGATGFVGASILHDLLEKGIDTRCLVRADTSEEARQRLEKTLKDYDLWNPTFASKISPVVGDMSQPLFGLAEGRFEDLADRVDAICHSGALVDWMRPLEEYVGPNIVSAHEVLRLASRGRAKAIHLISTISTLPKHMGLDLAEEDQEYGYGTSKYIAERMVAAARWRGAKATIYRLPYVTASSVTGRFRLDRGDFLHNFIVGCLEMGAFPSIDADMSAAFPVDYLSKTITAVMTQDFDKMGRDYDFLNTRAPTCTEFFKLLGATSSGGKEILKFSAWKQRALDYAIAHPTGAVARITAVLDSYTDETAVGMFKGTASIGEHVFGSSEYPAPPMREQFARQYLASIIAMQAGQTSIQD